MRFDCRYPIISSKLFKEYYWFDFYRDINEAITPNMPEAGGHKLSISVFVDAELSGDKSPRRTQTGVLIFIDKAPIHFYRKRKANVEANTLGA